jgi:hypothetical protein
MKAISTKQEIPLNDSFRKMKLSTKLESIDSINHIPGLPEPIGFVDAMGIKKKSIVFNNIKSLGGKKLANPSAIMAGEFKRSASETDEQESVGSFKKQEKASLRLPLNPQGM